jgi:hypothetical protein
LLTGFEANDAVEIANHHGKRMRAQGGAEDVVGVLDSGNPVSHRFVDRFFQGGLSGGDGNDFGSHESHAGHVEGLSLHIDGTHVNGAAHAKTRTDGCGGDAVLTGSGFGNDALFAKALGEEDLADGVIDFVGPGVEEVLSF